MFTDREESYPRLCAHRGYSAFAPENSLLAFEAALEIGAQEIEFDVQMTADYEVVPSMISPWTGFQTAPAE